VNVNTIRMIDIVARVMMAALFVYSGVGKLVDPSTVASRLTGTGFPLPQLSAYVAIVIELGGALALIAGYRLVMSCAVLAGDTVLVTALFHPFWTFEAAQRVGQTIQFLKNACILAGLWFVVRTTLLEAAHQAGGVSTPVAKPAAAE
jgi:putative oxidoreductase